MPFKCIFRTCRGNYTGGPRVSTFSFPRDENLAKKWLAAIPRPVKLTKNSKVCELHFKPSDIITSTKCYDSKTGKMVTVRHIAPRLAPDAVPSCIPRVPIPENIAFVPHPQKNKHPKVQVKKKNFEEKSKRISCKNLKDKHSNGNMKINSKSKLVSNFKENERTDEVERTSPYKAPAILYINPSSTDKNDVNKSVSTADPKENVSTENEGLAVLPSNNQPSEMTLLYGPFSTIEVAASLLHGTNATVYSLDCDKSQDSTLNQVFKVEQPSSSEEVSENSTGFDSESMTVDTMNSNNLSHFSNRLEDSNHNMLDNSNANLEKTITSREEESDESDDLYFFKSLLPDLKNLSRAKKTYIRLKIQELIYKEIYNCNKN